MTFRIILTLLIANNWDADIVDIETSFLYVYLDDEIYLRILEGLDTYTNAIFDSDDCFVLKKTMYGLVQAARQYYRKFIEIMTKEMRFEKCLADSCLFKTDQQQTYGDDMCLRRRYNMLRRQTSD